MLSDLIKKTLYKSGLLSLVHRKRNRHALTVVLFHRVFSSDDIRLLQADMEWAVTEDFFRDCLDFYKRYYNIISLQQLQAFLETGKPLPDYPLLITFDDGWADNLEYAAPITQQYGVRPLLCVTTGAIGKPMLSWQETLYSAWRINALPRELLNKIADIIQQPVQEMVGEKDIRLLIKTIQHRSEDVREAVSRLAETITLPNPAQMLTVNQLNQLSKSFDIGAHGVRHEYLTQSKNPMGELRQARQDINAMTGLSLPLSKSYPHGRHNDELIKMATDAGYTMMFTCIRCHTKLHQKKPAIFGRHNMNQLVYQDDNGRLRPELLSLYLFRQPIMEL